MGTTDQETHEDARKAVARRCAEIVMETRLLRRAERVYHADSSNVRGLLDCAYRESALQILREFGLRAAIPADTEQGSMEPPARLLQRIEKVKGGLSSMLMDAKFCPQNMAHHFTKDIQQTLQDLWDQLDDLAQNIKDAPDSSVPNHS